tara:strand:+ start:85 stop:588 length:504 start_codon:yes stop_codon:yes gene_type:complete
MTMTTRRGTLIATIAVVALSYGTVACSDDDATSSDTTETTSAVEAEETPSTERDRDRDRDRIQDAAMATVAACQNDQDRLRDQVSDQLRDQLQDRLRDQTCLLEDAEDVTVLDEDIEIDGDRATVRVTFRNRNQGEDQGPQQHTWHFRWTEEGGWLLDELDPLFEEG